LDLTIVIVNWNAGAALRGCLQSIRVCRPQQPVRAIVVDNASTDGSPEIVQREFPEVHLLNSGGNLGFARANNLARPHITSDLVLFLNPDSVLQVGAIDAMTTVMQQSQDVGAVGCKMRYADGRVWQQLVQRFPSPWVEFLGILLASRAGRRRLRGLFPYLDPDRSSYASKLCGGCLMARKAVLDSVGWFDERYFMYAEDADLSRSISDRGWKLFYVSEGEVSHAGGESSRRAPSDFPVLMHCESMSKLMGKYFGRGGALNYRIAIFAGATLRLASLFPVSILRWFVPALREFQLVNALRKYRLMAQWSVGLKRPAIPGPAF
jgi:GT2 family glycosyltransferase